MGTTYTQCEIMPIIPYTQPLTKPLIYASFFQTNYLHQPSIFVKACRKSNTYFRFV